MPIGGLAGPGAAMVMARLFPFFHSGRSLCPVGAGAPWILGCSFRAAVPCAAQLLHPWLLGSVSGSGCVLSPAPVLLFFRIFS